MIKIDEKILDQRCLRSGVVVCILLSITFALPISQRFFKNCAFAHDASSFSTNMNSTNAVTTDETARCLACHSVRQVRLVETWEKSTHARNGVGCYECHKANKSDPAAKNGHFGLSVQLPVSPLRCAECHIEEYTSFASSSHASTFDRIKDLPIRKQSPMIFEQSCAICHGNELRMEHGRPLDNTWPNHGIGRINTDGSRGNCAACHGHHDDSLARVRSAETCGKCHNNDATPAMSAWQSSRHGNEWHLTSKKNDLEKTDFKPVNEMIKRPNCYICHIAPANETDSATHNLGDRISWHLAVSESKLRDGWGKKRLAMQKSCKICHGGTQIDMYYRRLDATVMEFNKLYKSIKKRTDLSDTAKANKIKDLLMKGKTGVAMQSPRHVTEAIKALSDY